jgi:hypothetical protein
MGVCDAHAVYDVHPDIVEHCGRFSWSEPSIFGIRGSEEAAIEVAYVSEVSGRVVALMQGKPTLLDALDIITDRTRLDLKANSELRMCHSQTHQLFTLRGPLNASISRGGVTAENGEAVVASAGSCAAPTASVFQAGFVSRGVPARR